MRRLFVLALLVVALFQGGASSEQQANPPTEYECRPYIEKALAGQATADAATDEGGLIEEEGGRERRSLPDDEGEGDGEGEESSMEMMQADQPASEDPDTSAQGNSGEDIQETNTEQSKEESVEGEGVENTEQVGEGESTEQQNAVGESTEQAVEENLEQTVDGAESTEQVVPDQVSEESTEEAATEESTEGDSVEQSTEGGSTEGEQQASEGADSTEQATEEGAEQSTEGGESTEQATQEGTEQSTEGGESTEQATEEGTEQSTEGGESTEQAIEGETTEQSTEGESVEEIVGEVAEETVSGESTEQAIEGGVTEESTEGETTESTEEVAIEPAVEVPAEGEVTEPTVEGEATEPAVEGEATEPATEGEATEPTVEGEATEPATEGEATEPTVEGEATEPTVEGEATEPATEGEATEPAVEGEVTEVAVEGEATEVAVEGEATEPTVEGEATEAAIGEVTEAALEGEVIETAVEGEAAEVSETTEPEATTSEGAAVQSEPVEGQETGAEPTEPETVSAEEIVVVEEEVIAAEVPVEEEPEPMPEEELSFDMVIPDNLRPRDHIASILKLDEDSIEDEVMMSKTVESTLKGLKKFYDSAIKPLEILYKYRDLSNRHFGDPEIFSKPLILFMGPWSGGKSSIINYLLDNEYKQSSLRTGAEPSPAYFNLVMWGEREEVLDGTQLAADWTFSGLQKFGQGLLDRLRGLRLKNRLLEKVNIVEIPGILEVRKQVERVFPFNDACQWFIDRADIIFLVYDPSKLDVGPETEAILDQLKGREYQTRILLNKADQVHPEELMRVQGTLIWNISPLMSSTQPPVMYTTSLWSNPYELGAPLRLLRAQERAFLRDMREAIDKRIDNKIASARRFAVRVRNHAKMVDCYLTTYYNHKSFFGNRKKVADDIIEKPQDYHIYEGLSTLTNISRYDLPDPETYRDFFKVNPLYDFQLLSATCTYFQGCPINRLDIAIAYELPELLGKYKKAAEDAVPKQVPEGKS